MTDEGHSARQRIAELSARLRELESALAENRHRLRRVEDGIERAGSATGGLATERDRLRRNLERDQRERDTVKAELDRLRTG